MNLQIILFFAAIILGGFLMAPRPRARMAPESSCPKCGRPY